MSTFDGRVAEFPDIAVDFFRRSPGRAPALACFLSHVHSDHLAGLETLRSPFVYCSAATRELLLRLERFPCRISYAKGILEARVQTYKHLKNLLKPIPLETPTTIELGPGNHIQVTLFNANHCPGAVMFLFEGPGKAALYTGDIRSEPWLVNALTRNPSLVEYAYGLKSLDTIYLDTSFIDDVAFQTKAEGIRELLQKVAKYPPETIFYFQAWTYGYEDVWVALSKALGSKVHVDEYKMRVYKSLVRKDPNSRYAAEFYAAPEAPALVGYMCGNTRHEGCLTTDEKVRLHSCEKGNYCGTVQNFPVVWIQPVITHLPNGQDVAEIGVGGGGEDLERDAELESLSSEEIQHLLQIIGDADNIPDELKEGARASLLHTLASGRNISLDLDMSTFGDQNQAMLETAIQAIAKRSQLGREAYRSSSAHFDTGKSLPRSITFPYSRHSSYPELCHLVSALKPKDVWPCTVNPREWARNGVSIRKLFGEHCSGPTFRHDVLMESLVGDDHIPSQQDLGDRETDSSMRTSFEGPVPLHQGTRGTSPVFPDVARSSTGASPERDLSTGVGDSHLPVHIPSILFPNPRERPFGGNQEALRNDLTCRTTPAAAEDDDDDDDEEEEEESPPDSQLSSASTISQTAHGMRAEAFHSMLANVRGNSTEWRHITLVSASDNHTSPDGELGGS